MPDPSITASGERFARDMRRIREEHGVSLEDIHEETMISMHIIESFEQDGLFEHPTFNRVYLRSFMRSYANAAQVDPERALEELERAVKGEYANELAVEYLGDDPIKLEVPAKADEDEGDEPADEMYREDTAPSERTAPRTRSTAPPEPAGRPVPPDADAEPSEASEPPSALPEGSRQGIIIGIGVVLLGVIAWVLIDVLQGGDAGTTQPSPGSRSAAMDTADSAQLDPVPPESLRAQPSVAIGDTMYFTVIAQERVNPIRIRRDEDLRRPYYLNRGQAGVFPAQQQIVLEDGLENIRLLVNGHEYPAQARAAGGSLVLTRDSVQAFLDTTDTTPLSLVVPADTFQVLGSG